MRADTKGSEDALDAAIEDADLEIEELLFTLELAMLEEEFFTLELTTLEAELFALELTTLEAELFALELTTLEAELFTLELITLDAELFTLEDELLLTLEMLLAAREEFLELTAMLDTLLFTELNTLDELFELATELELFTLLIETTLDELATTTPQSLIRLVAVIACVVESNVMS